jgi:hypothetical protein
VFGDDDMIQERPYKATLTCIKNYSFVYVMMKADFFRIFKNPSESWRSLVSLSKQK